MSLCTLLVFIMLASAFGHPPRTTYSLAQRYLKTMGMLFSPAAASTATVLSLFQPAPPHAINMQVPSLKAITENLARAEKTFLSLADEIPAERWKARPGADRWSAGELVCHLIMVEQTIIERAGKLVQKPPRPRPFLKRFHLPLALVEVRLIRRKTPIPLDPALVTEKEAMLTQLRSVRECTCAFIEETRGKDLSKYHMPHPFLGTLSTYEWFQMIASHQLRHTKQMKEIAAAFQKTSRANY